MAEHNLLIVEDDKGLRNQMRWCFSNCNVFVAEDAPSALTALDAHKPAVVTLDLGLPPDPGGDSAGLKLLGSILERAPDTKVIVVTGREERDSAVNAIALGAYDFYQKPLDAEILEFVVERAFRLSDLEQEKRNLESAAAHAIPGMIAASRAMESVARLISRVAPTDANVLIQGETGTGKELVAQAIHQLSERSGQPLTVINCAAIPENLLESELFGHEKGAFTGATGKKIGSVEEATGGTLFLDEIGDMALPLQAKILRFLQERVIQRVGGTQPIPVDVRVVAATHQPLSERVAAQQFREDLLFRLSEITIELPPLRDREDDVLLIANALIRKHAGERRLRLSNEAIAAIQAARWPGNVRELGNRVKRACILTDGGLIHPQDLELAEPDLTAMPSSDLNLKAVRAEAEIRAIRTALLKADNNISQTARILGVSRPTLYDLLKRHEVVIDDEG
ncbi:MAG: PEP-CTERM-box response regulator transcription factor [Pseudomonadota bacterium]